jgi:oligoendopeptidase F
MTKTKTLPTRDKVSKSDTWNLASLFKSDKAWDAKIKQWQKQIDGYAKYRGKLGTSARRLAECLAFDASMDLSLIHI